MTPGRHRNIALAYAIDAIGYFIRGDQETAEQKHRTARIHMAAAILIEQARERANQEIDDGIETTTEAEALRPEAASPDPARRTTRAGSDGE